MRRVLIVGVAAAALMSIAGPVLADTSSGSTESHQECTTDPDTGQETCTTVYDNDVQCGAGQEAATPAGNVTVSGLPDGSAPSTGGELEVCSSDSQVIQGRVIASGSAETQSGYVAADGDRDNNENANGWLRVDGSPTGPPTVRCGDETGNLDATNPTDADTQDDCPQPAAP